MPFEDFKQRPQETVSAKHPRGRNCTVVTALLCAIALIVRSVVSVRGPTSVPISSGAWELQMRTGIRPSIAG